MVCSHLREPYSEGSIGSRAKPWMGSLLTLALVSEPWLTTGTNQALRKSQKKTQAGGSGGKKWTLLGVLECPVGLDHEPDNDGLPKVHRPLGGEAGAVVRHDADEAVQVGGGDVGGVGRGREVDPVRRQGFPEGGPLSGQY